MGRLFTRAPAGRPSDALVALMAAVACLGVAWALVTPAWQAPDEAAHFSYVQSLFERGALPAGADRSVLSTEVELSRTWLQSRLVEQRAEARSPWSRAAEERWRAEEARLGAESRADGGGFTPPSGNPPLYYLSVLPAYAVAGGTVFDRLLAMRLLSIVWLLVTVAAAWALVGELLPGRPLLQLAGAATAGMLPMVSFVSAAVNPDAAIYAIWTVVLLSGVRLLRSGLSTPWIVALGAGCSLAVLTKPTSWALVPGALFALGAAARRSRRAGEPFGRSLAAGTGAFAVPLAAGAALLRRGDRPVSDQVETLAAGEAHPLEFASYLWQFYLPAVPGQEVRSPYEGKAAWEVWLEGGWATFGWLEIQFAEPVYWVLAAATLLVAAGAGVALWRARSRVDRAVLVFFALVVLALLAGLHWTDYRLSVVLDGRFMQGRYLLPLAGLAGLAVAAALSALAPAVRRRAAELWLAGLVTLQVASLGLVLARFYA